MSTPSQRETREMCPQCGAEVVRGAWCRQSRTLLDVCVGRTCGWERPAAPLAPSEAGGREVFNEQSLRAEIVRVWGPAGAHVDVFDTLLASRFTDAGRWLEEEWLTRYEAFLRDTADKYEESRDGLRLLEAYRALASRPTGEDSARAEVEAERDRLAKQCDQWEEDNRVLAFNARRQLQAVQQEVERIKALKPDYTAPEEYHRAVREKAADILAAIARASEGSPS